MFHVRRREFPLQYLSLYAHLPNASVTSYGPSHLGLSLPLSSARLASLFCSNGFGMQFTGITASVLYVSKNGVSLLLDLIMSLACGCLTEAKHWRIQSFSHQSLNGLSLNCFSLSDMISPGRSNLYTMLSHTNFLTWAPVIVAIEMGLLAFIHVADPTKVKVGERERTKEEARLLDSTVGRVVPLLPIAPDRADSELEASMEKLFDESGGANQGDSVAGGGQEIETEIVLGVRFVDEDNVVSEKPKRPRKKRQAATDVSSSSHPPKKLRSDHGTSSRAASSGKSPTVLKQLLASSILNVESGVEAVATLPFVTSSVSATPEHESGVPADSITGLNLRTIGASKRFVISSDSSHHSSTNVLGAEGDSLIRSASGFHHDDRGGFHPIMYASIHSDTTPESWTITGSFPSSQETSFPWGSGVDYESFMRFLFCHCERRRLESECEKQVGLLRSKDKEIENLKAQLLFKEAEAAEKNMALEDEKKSLSGKVAELQSLVSVKDRELKDVDATVTSLKSQNNRLADQVPCAGAHVRPVNERVEKLDADLAEMACHLEEKFYPHLLTTIFGRGEPFNHGLEACSSGIDPWQGTGEKLADIVAYKPSVTCGFQFCPTRALPLADAPSMGRLQHDIEQLKVPIHSTSISVPGATGTTTALSTTFASASSIPPISVKDY
ncbi:hypothetical protein Tco_1359896 [Tanacetum coccineum]